MPLTAESLEAEEKRIHDAYARRRSGFLYSRFNRAYLFMVQERELRLLDLLARYGFGQLGGRKILEIGCGNGDLLRDFIKWGARPENLVGVELIDERVADAIIFAQKTSQSCRAMPPSSSCRIKSSIWCSSPPFLHPCLTTVPNNKWLLKCAAC